MAGNKLTPEQQALLDEATSKTRGVYERPYQETTTPAQRWALQPAKSFDVYRTDPKTGSLETLAHKYSLGMAPDFDETKQKVIDPGMLHALVDAKKLNPSLQATPAEMTALLAQEGRGDFGANDLDVSNFAHNKKAMDLHAKLTDMGYSDEQAALPALLIEKQRVANKHGVTWQEAWNGLGTTETGRTGKDYAREMQMNLKNAPLNKAALSAISQAMSEPAKPATRDDINWQQYRRRAQTLNMQREKLKASGMSDVDIQKALPDVPVPLSNDPNAAVTGYARGGRARGR